jgi:hypothetical protein
MPQGNKIQRWRALPSGPAKWQIFAGPGILGQLEADLPQQQDGLRVADLFGPPMGPRSVG